MRRDTIKVIPLFLFIFLFLFSLLTCNDEKKKVSTTSKDEKLSFIISYKSNGADFGTAPISQEGNEELPQKIKFNEGNLFKSGFLFDGWNSAADGSGTDYTPGTSYIGKSITLYAKWKTSTYNDYLSIAKDFENKGQWCHALGAYYDALGTDGAPESKIEAYNAYNELADEIRKGNPGIGQFNVFTQHDEWKKMLIDAERYGSEIVPYIVKVGNLKQKYLDYQTKTATYSANIEAIGFNDRYKKTIAVIKAGYENAFKEDWSSDLPKPFLWPRHSVSSRGESIYDVNGALIYIKDQNTFFNAFSYLLDNISLFVYEFNITDEYGNALVNRKRLLLASEDEIVFSEIKPEVMDLIDNGKAWVSPVAVYLNYGKYNEAYGEGGTPFIKNLKERQLPLNKAVFVGNHCNDDVVAINVAEVINNEALKIVKMVPIPGRDFEMLNTEVTQDMYIKIMGKNPSYFKLDALPVEQVSWDDAIEFCNSLSKKFGLTPVYTIHEFNRVTQNTSSNGFRLPTAEEWQYAAKGGENYKYAGSDIVDEVAWYCDNSGLESHPVGQKKANGYGLYDMSGNVEEWCSDVYRSNYNTRYCYGGGFSSFESGCKVDYRGWAEGGAPSRDTGFRIVRNIK